MACLLYIIPHAAGTYDIIIYIYIQVRQVQQGYITTYRTKINSAKRIGSMRVVS